MMSASRREEMLRAYMRHARRFDEIASRSQHSTGLFPGIEAAPVPRLHTEPVPQRPTGALSRREQDVLTLVAEGLSNREVGAELQITEDTVKTHVQHILRVLDARNRAHAVSLGHARGLLGGKMLGAAAELDRATLLEQT